jgi:NO-binding membrane sensor protein with MHYT domain
MNGSTTVLSTSYDILLTIMSAVVPFVLCLIGLLICSLQLLLPQVVILPRLCQQCGLVSPLTKTHPEETKDTDSEVEQPKDKFTNKFYNRLPTKQFFISSLIGNDFKPNILQIIIGALFCATGVCAMHYMGMEATHIQGTTHYYNSGMVFGSVVIALVACIAALWIAFNVERDYMQVLSSIIAAVAVCGMHYCGMFSAHYQLGNNTHSSSGTATMNSTDLILIITLATSILCFILLIVSSIAGRKRFQYAQKLEKIERDTVNQHMMKMDIMIRRIASAEFQTRRVMDLVSDAVCLIDPEGEITKANAAFYRMTATTVGDEYGVQDLFIDLPSHDSLFAARQSKITCAVKNKILGSIDVEVLANVEDAIDITFCVLIIRPLTMTRNSEFIFSSAVTDRSSISRMLTDISNEIFMQDFMKFSEVEHSTESLEFIIAVKAYRKLTSVMDRVKYQETILSEFIRPGSKKQLNLPTKILEIAMKNAEIGYGQIDLFDMLEAQVLELLLDSYHRFISNKQKIEIYSTNSEV